MNKMTWREAAAFAGCSISTLKRYRCAWCEETALYQLTRGCGANYEHCNPMVDKTWPPAPGRIPGSKSPGTGLTARHDSA